MTNDGKNRCSVCKQFGHNKQNCPTSKMMRDHKADQFIQILEAMPLKETILSLLFIYAWKEAYGDKFSIGDIALGITYGFTIPDALQGDLIANGYAVSALGILGAGFIPPHIVEDAQDKVEWYIASGSPAFLAYKLAGEIPDGAKDLVRKIFEARRII